MKTRVPRTALLILASALLVTGDAWAARRFPNILVIAVDTLRADHLSSYGYARATSPAIDALLAGGARFTQMRVVEPLTEPSMCSIFTSLHPHEHGATRNGLALRPGLPSLGKVLAKRGYRTAAFVGNWTLRNQISGLGEHFETFREVFTRKRWFGLFNAEATAEDLTAQTLDWLAEHRRDDPGLPFMVWVHYVEPHAPYRLHPEFLSRLGISRRHRRSVAPADRYDTEIAFVDQAIGVLLRGVREHVEDEDLMVLFLSDHGESLGEHGDWGHGRHLFETTLRVPLGIVWHGRVPPQQLDGLASTLDLAPSVLGLVGLPIPETFRGHDWSATLAGRSSTEPGPSATFHQAHKGALRGGGSEAARRKGLLEVGWVTPDHKEIISLRGKNNRQVYALEDDPQESRNLAKATSPISDTLRIWLEEVRSGLAASDTLPTPALDAEAVERLRALGYLDN